MASMKGILSKTINLIRNKKQPILVIVLIINLVMISGCEDQTQYELNNPTNQLEQQEKVDTSQKEKEDKDVEEKAEEKVEETPKTENKKLDKETTSQNTSNTSGDIFKGFEIIEVDGGDLSGHRRANVAVDIGYGSREYWAFTNEHGQLVRVVAKEIILQDDKNEPVLSSGRYYSDEAKVPGVESKTLDEGHIIADSLGGVSNAYNITPQNSTLNRHGDQAYMEKIIRDAGGCTDFEAIITYPNTETQIPSKYKYTYTVKGNVIVDEFENINPDDYNKSQGITQKEKPKKTETSKNVIPSTNAEGDLSKVDTNGNGKVTIAEAKSAGYKMPITRDHWLYKYMTDRDGDGLVGE